MLKRLVGRLDRWQRTQPVAGFAVGVGRKFAEDRASRHAVRIAYYGFLSIFPLLLAFVSVVGFVLEGDPDRRADVLNSTYAELPVIGPLVRSDIGTIGGSGVALAVGVAVALWAGLGVTLALGEALDEVSNVPPFEQLGYVSRRLRGFAVLVFAGVAIVASSVLSGLLTSGTLSGPVWAEIGGVVLSQLVDGGCLLAAFRLLPTERPALRELWPGMIVAVIGLFALQTIGALYLDHTISRASNTYGLFATVIGLLSWLSLASQLIMLCAEVNVVTALRLWPRSLSGDPTPADTRAMERYAAAARHDKRARVKARWSR